MDTDKKIYFKNIDLIRLLACLIILLYHFNIMKGGYLAVCTFFVLSGYLSCVSAFKKEKFSILSYYFNRLIKIYLPLVIVVFITIAIIPLFSDITWINLKPETTSVLFGYNNFWQLNASLGYFTRHINSPFIHLWYISILLQFELAFPFIYVIFRKLGDKINKIIPCTILVILSVIFSIYFYRESMTQNIMTIYYGTFTRIFSLLFGIALGFIHSYYSSLVPKLLKKDVISKIIFFAYLITLIILCIFIDAKSIYFSVSMIAITLITCRLIDYSTIGVEKGLSFFDKIIKSLSSISYEVYLFQYPLIFLFQYINIENYIKIPIIILLLFVLSYILHFCTNFKNKKLKIFRYIISIIILCMFFYGCYRYCMSEDHTKEMKELEEQLAKNEKIMQEKQEEYELQLKHENDEWMSMLKDLENNENELKSTINNLPVVGIGDSIMLGAIRNLYKEFPNGYFDAQNSRTSWVVNDILQDLENKNILGNPIIINLGSNGDCPESYKIEIIEKCGERDVFWINVSNDKEVKFNDNLLSLSYRYDNLHIIDWNSISKGHPEYFISDGLHLTQIGKEAYTKSIFDAIYKIYLEKYRQKKEEIIKKYEEKSKNKITFYGNDVLLNAYEYIKPNFSQAKFIINKEFNFKNLKEEIEKSIKDNYLSYKIVFAFDSTMDLGIDEYKELIKICSDHEIYFLSISKKSINNLLNINYENVTIINFYEKIKSSTGYLMADRIHLTKIGNIALSEILKDFLIK